jgi:hypothetical protein
LISVRAQGSKNNAAIKTRPAPISMEPNVTVTFLIKIKDKPQTTAKKRSKTQATRALLSVKDEVFELNDFEKFGEVMDLLRIMR